MNAFNDLTEQLDDDEEIEAIVFGAWGGGGPPEDGKPWRLGTYEPDPPPVPFDKRGQLLSPDEASSYMRGWSFFGGYGAPGCYAIRVWTNQRVFWVTQYDGSTTLDSATRHPVAMMPDMPGG